MGEAFNPVSLLSFLLLAALIPFFVVSMTGFLKISLVLFLVRNALGIQQTPPNLVLYAIALVLTFYITTPLLAQMYAQMNAPGINLQTFEGLQEATSRVRQPVREHLTRFTDEKERQFFLSATTRIWPESARTNVRSDDVIILLPAFISSELTRAFEIGFLLYLPFLVIDVVVSNILMAMGMIMVSPVLISVPLKLFLFVSVDGWSRLLHGLILSYGI
jgi:type III secretion protein R